jgi:O-acetylhomoserine/O-acetylserine sulfhydrylase-like pyridoxal-dependent enzyme
VYTEAFGPAAYVGRARVVPLRNMGAAISPFNSFLILQGIETLALFVRLVNIGDAKSLACHPASTTHRQLNPAELEKAGVSEDMVRLSIGIEHVDDLLADLEQALAAA